MKRTRRGVFASASSTPGATATSTCAVVGRDSAAASSTASRPSGESAASRSATSARSPAGSVSRPSSSSAKSGFPPDVRWTPRELRTRDGRAVARREQPSQVLRGQRPDGQAGLLGEMQRHRSPIAARDQRADPCVPPAAARRTRAPPTRDDRATGRRRSRAASARCTAAPAARARPRHGLMPQRGFADARVHPRAAAPPDRARSPPQTLRSVRARLRGPRSSRPKYSSCGHAGSWRTTATGRRETGWATAPAAGNVLPMNRQLVYTTAALFAFLTALSGLASSASPPAPRARR